MYDMLVVGRPKLYDEELFMDYTQEILKTGVWSNNGPFVTAIENFYPQVDCAVVSNATLGLELLVRSLQLPPKSRIACPAYTFAASATAIRRAGHEVVFIDSNKHYCMSIDDLERKAKLYKIDAVLAVHLFGNLCDIDYLEENFETVVYDAAHCNGMNYEGDHLGRFGKGAVFSYHPTKLGGGFELGTVCSSDPKIIERVKLDRN